MTRLIYGEEIIRLPSISAWKDPASLAEWTLPRLEHFVGRVETERAVRLPVHVQYGYRTFTRDQLRTYRDEKRAFEAALTELPLNKATKTRDTFEAFRFVDWEHYAADAMTSFLSHGKKPIDVHEISLRYNPNNDPNEPTFSNIQSASRYLAQTRALPSLGRLLKVHSLTMANSVDGLRSEDLGRVRDVEVHGDESENGITQAQLRTINKNPYLSFAATDPVQDANPDRIYGDIVYPNPAVIKELALTRIAQSHKSTFRDVSRFQALSISEQRRASSSNYRALTEALITALAEERYANYHTNIDMLESSGKDITWAEIINICSDHYGDLVSIHALPDGNGRTLRLEALYDPLNKRGIPRPRLSDPNGDILESPSKLRRQCLKGVVATDNLYSDMTLRIRKRLPMENSPEIVFPNVLRDIGAEEVQHHRKAVTKNRATMPLAPAQFGAYLEVRFKEDSQLKARYSKNPIEVMGALRAEYKAFTKATQRLLNHTKDGLTVVRLMFVDADFSMTFGENFAADKERWDYKLATWYTPDLIWRGLSDCEHAQSDAEVLKIFTRPTAHTVSENMLRHNGLSGRPSQIISRIQAEFARYNSDIVSGALAKVAIDHINGKGLYETSYCLSTSLRISIAKEFARGKLALGDTPEAYKHLQHLLKDRIVLGAFRAYKDVDSMTLRRVAPTFKHPPNRQAEVLAVGGIDPDAVMCVYRLDARGNVSESWIRDPENPSQVFQISGDASEVTAAMRKTTTTDVVRRHHLF